LFLEFEPLVANRIFVKFFKFFLECINAFNDLAHPLEFTLVFASKNFAEERHNHD